VVNALLIDRAPLNRALALSVDQMKTLQGMAVAPEQVWAKPKADAVAFTREELSRILGLYGQFVAAGEWRDYAIDHLKDAAVFSIFRRSAETPLYRVEKRPALSQRQGAYAVVSMTGVILKRGHDLAQVLKVFDRQRLRLAD
jgi:hypothetical protein